MREHTPARAAALALLIGTAMLCACTARPDGVPPPSDGGSWIALPKDAPSGQLVSWVRGPFVFVMRSDDVLAALESVPGDASRQAAIRAALLAHANDPGTDVLFLNAVIGNSPHLHAAFGPVLADLLTERRASLIDTERGFVIGSVQEVARSTRAARYRSFQTRDGREVLRVADPHWTRGFAL